MDVRRARLPVVVGLVGLAAAACGGDGSGEGTGEPDLARGRELFEANCAVCHGEDARGTTQGPPLVHEIYEPGHHSDDAFQVAVAQGSPQHHWDFGPMPAVPGLDRDEVADITAYVRQLQREAGLIE